MINLFLLWIIINTCLVSGILDLRNVMLVHPDNACTVTTDQGFHVQNINHFIDNILSLTDCMLVCMQRDDCLSVNFVKISSTIDGIGRRKCFLSTSNIQPLQKLHPVDKSIYASFSCRDDIKKPQFMSNIFHGTAPRQCGVTAFNNPPAKSSSVQTKRIVGGTNAPPYSQPWLGVITRQWEFMCCTSLLTNDTTETTTLFAISAAHCFYDNRLGYLQKDAFGFLFGVHDLRFPSAHSVLRKAEEIFLHPAFDETTNDNDVAIIRFREKVRFNDYVRPICLAELSSGASHADPPATIASSVCGYGALSRNKVNGKHLFGATPRCFMTKLALATPSYAPQQWTPNTYYLSRIDLIRYKGISVGDSGGPVASLVNNQYTLFGISSSSKDSRKTHVAYNMYVRVYCYLKWIRIIFSVDSAADRLEVSTEEYLCSIFCFPRC